MMFFISKVDFKAAFLQEGPAQHDVYVRPPEENVPRFVLWILKVATYGLARAHAKWTSQADELLASCGLTYVALNGTCVK